jgi:hypothetical protein
VGFQGRYVTHHIPVQIEANTLGTHDRVQMAVNMDPSQPPERRSRLWYLVAAVPNNRPPPILEARLLGFGRTGWMR